MFVPGIICAGTFMSEYPRMFLGPPVQAPLCLSIPGFPRILGRSQDVPGITCAGTLSTCIQGFPGYSDNPRMFQGTTCAITFLSEYPKILRILGRPQNVSRTTYFTVWVSQDSRDTRMIPRCPTPLSEYPRISRILWRSQDATICKYIHL